MSYVRTDPVRLAESARRFDEQAAQVAALLDRYSTRMDPVVSGSDPATKPLTGFAPSIESHKEGMRVLQEFCVGMAERIRIAARNYSGTNEALEEEAGKLLAHVDSEMNAISGAGTAAPAAAD